MHLILKTLKNCILINLHAAVTLDLLLVITATNLLISIEFITLIIFFASKYTMYFSFIKSFILYRYFYLFNIRITKFKLKVLFKIFFTFKLTLMSSFSNNSVNNFYFDSKLYSAYKVLNNFIKNEFLIITKVILQQINTFIKALFIFLDFNLLTFVFLKLSIIYYNSKRGLIFLFLFFLLSINMKLINFL
jgi:hypothetical protein